MGFLPRVFSILKIILNIAVIVIMSLSVKGCEKPDVFKVGISNCNIGELCQITGKLEVFHGSSGGGGSLAVGKECIALALDASISIDSKKWDDKLVRISGEVFEQYYDPIIISYKLLDRNVIAGICNSEKVIYVRKITIIKADVIY